MAFGTWVQLRCYCALHELDSYLTRVVVQFHASPGTIRRMLAVGMLAEEGEGYRLLDFASSRDGGTP